MFGNWNELSLPRSMLGAFPVFQPRWCLQDRQPQWRSSVTQLLSRNLGRLRSKMQKFGWMDLWRKWIQMEIMLRTMVPSVVRFGMKACSSHGTAVPRVAPVRQSLTCMRHPVSHPGNHFKFCWRTDLPIYQGCLDIRWAIIVLLISGTLGTQKDQTMPRRGGHHVRSFNVWSLPCWKYGHGSVTVSPMIWRLSRLKVALRSSKYLEIQLQAMWSEWFHVSEL